MVVRKKKLKKSKDKTSKKAITQMQSAQEKKGQENFCAYHEMEEIFNRCENQRLAL